MEEQFLTLDQIIERYPAIARLSLYRAIEKGELTATKIGRNYLIKPEWLNVWIARRTINPKAATPDNEQKGFV